MLSGTRPSTFNILRCAVDLAPLGDRMAQEAAWGDTISALKHCQHARYLMLSMG